MTTVANAGITAPKTSIWRALEMSTAHLEEQVCHGLTTGTVKLPTSIKPDEYGFIVCVLNDIDRDGDYPECMRPHLQLARREGCSFLAYDRDASEIEGLPTWNW